jgi:flagellar motility protein MotE (MotC chaperone)
MVTEKEKDAAAKESENKSAGEKKSGGMLKYILMGAGVLALVVLVSFLTLLFIKDDTPQVTDESQTVAEAETDTSAEESTSEPVEDSLLVENDPTVLDKIMDNLSFLDYEPSVEEIAAEEEKMSVEDSIEAVNWLEKEKKRLAEKEKELEARARELDVRDKQVTQKILKLEQAESARIAKLAKLYDGMDPRSVAKLMANLDDATVVSILPRMKIKNASSVLALLPPKRAARLSKQMITIAEN